jgi:hypothetical protein
VTAVTYDLQDLSPGGQGLMINDLAVNTATGQAVPNCAYCCGMTSGYFNPDQVNVDFGQVADVSVEYRKIRAFGISGKTFQRH